MCDDKSKCIVCDNIFDKRKHLETTSFHQIEKDLTAISNDKARMIVDTGCPNSLLGIDDIEKFESSLSHVQQQNLEVIKVDQKFMFGPSGPYKCSEKLCFPIRNNEDILWVTVAVVDAKIPMLLGKNILKPLEAEIKLFSTGNGVLVLENTEIELKENKSGHYTIKVSDLGKLCDLELEDTKSLASHREMKHAIADRTFECRMCGRDYKSKTGRNIHMKMKHEVKDDETKAYISYDCEQCECVYRSKNGLRNHMEKVHMRTKPLRSAKNENEDKVHRPSQSRNHQRN